jgi:pimeloyl-ACP methyl ester carboxylesterase
MRRLVAGLALLVVAACGPPITVSRVSPRTVTADLTRSALNGSQPSVPTENTLYRWNLTDRFNQDPEGALAALHDIVVSGKGGPGTTFALAELCFEYADKSHKREYYLASAVYAYAYLFPGPKEEPPGLLDPRARTAADLYNRGLTQAFASPDGSRVVLQSGVYPLPWGQLAVYLDEASLRWGNQTLYDFVPVAELKVGGLGARYRRPGIGAPLAAKASVDDPAHQGKEFSALNVKVPVTAVLLIDDPRRQLAQPEMHAKLQVFDGFSRPTVDIDNRQVPLEVEPTAALAYGLTGSKVWSWELWGFLLGDLLGQERTSLAFAQPYRPGRIPVVFVHGTASSPGRWADMLNVLSNAPNLADRYQYWFFFYETGNPIPYSAMRLRESLEETVHRLDPEGKDLALHQMVVIGHSQGGLLTKMTAIDSGTKLWDAFSRKPIDQLKLSSETRDLLQRAMFIKPLPFVREVIFISTPHRGAYAAGWSIAHWVARFARLPQTLAGSMGDLLTGNAADIRLDPSRPHVGAVYGMTPGSPLAKTLVTIPLAPGVTAHSIIPIQGDLPPDDQGDGVVKYQSAHIEGVESELVVPHSGHSVQGNPIAIEEVRRILVEHADKVCATEKVACGPPPPGAPGPQTGAPARPASRSTRTRSRRDVVPVPRTEIAPAEPVDQRE